MQWARGSQPLIGCVEDAARTRYAYDVRPLGGSAVCDPNHDVMNDVATLDVRPWRGLFRSYNKHVALGRGVDGDVSLATGFDDPSLPRTDEVTWHLGKTAYALSVRYGDALALARSIIANLAVVAPSHRRTPAPPSGAFAAVSVEPGLVAGIAVLRRRTVLPIEVPRSPAIDASVKLLASSHEGGEYTYFLCRTIECSARGGIVAEVSASKIARGDGRLALNIDLGCGLRGNFQSLVRDRGAVPVSFAIVTWKQRQTLFTIVSAKDNPAHTDVVELARSIVSNACRVGH